MPATDDHLGIAISIAAPEYEITGGVGEDLAAGSTPPHGPILALSELIISPIALAAFVRPDDPSTYDTFSIPFTPPVH